MLVVLAILWAVIWVLALVDIVRHPRLSVMAKLLWALVVLVLPVVGLIVYFIARPPTPMAGNVPPDRLPEERLRGEHPV